MAHLFKYGETTTYCGRAKLAIIFLSAINDNSRHHIKPCGYQIYHVTFLPEITVSIFCDILYQLMTQFMTDLSHILRLKTA